MGDLGGSVTRFRLDSGVSCVLAAAGVWDWQGWCRVGVVLATKGVGRVVLGS